jgi:hypothetical protein
MHRAIVTWSLVFVFLAAGIGASIAALNNTVYSAQGFVRSYLEALERQDADAALAFDGVELPGGQNATLVADGALGAIGDIQLVQDVADGDLHHVTFAYSLGSATGTTEFEVERTGTRLGLFPTWRFAESPVATLAISAPRDPRVTVNGIDTQVAAEGTAFLVLAPGSFRLDHESTYLSAPEVTVPVSVVGAVVEAQLDAEPNEEFEAATDEAVGAFLDDCATQQVLMPTGCPFGYSEVNRVVGLPTWSIVDYPTVILGDGESEAQGQWFAAGTLGTAHIVMEVRSLFDGTESTVDEDVSFSGDYLIVLSTDDELTVAEAP